MNRWKAVSLCLVMAWGLFVPGLALGAQGDLLWEKQITFLPAYDTITINYSALSTTSYIVSGNARHSDGTEGMLGFIKAYDVATGDIKWEKTLSLGAATNNFGIIVINGDIAIVRGGYSTGLPPTVIKNLSGPTRLTPATCSGRLCGILKQPQFHPRLAFPQR